MRIQRLPVQPAEQGLSANVQHSVQQTPAKVTLPNIKTAHSMPGIVPLFCGAATQVLGLQRQVL